MTARHWCPIGVVLIAVLNADGVAANAAIGRGVPATAAIPPERAEVEPLEVEVTVVDEKLRPVAGALVEAVGERTTSFVGRTGEAGVVTVRVKRGQHLAARDGSAVSSVEAAVSATLRLVVRLQNIGSVRARGAQERTTAASARALISGSITGGLGYVPDYRSAAQGGSGRQSLNGVPLDLPAPPGTASASGGIPSDLISSFDAVQADDGSYPDYHLLAPTPDFRATFTAGAASSDGSLWKASMAGPDGNLHYALALAAGGDDGRLAGQTFSDNSGVRYDHATGERHTAVSLTGNTQLGPVNVAFLGFDTNRSAAYITTNRPGDIVNGLGPGNRTGGDTGLEFLLATWSHGHDSFSAIDGRYRGAGTFDFTHALVDGIATPSDSGYRYDGRFESVNWTHSFGPNALSLKAAANENTSNAFYRTNDSPVQSGGGWVRTGSQMLSLAYRVGHGDASAGASFTAQRAGGAFAGSFLDATAFAARRIAGIDARIAVAATEAQTQEASYATTYSLAPPQTAAVTCAPATATVSGPADVGTTHPRSRTISLSLSRGGANGSVRVGAFRSDISNALVFANVGGTALPSGYVAQLGAFVESLCPGETLSAAGTFVQRYETVGVLRQAQAYVDAIRRLGPVSLEAFYETFTDAPAQTAAGLGGERTTLVPGAQLANIAPHRAGLTAAFSHGSALIAMGARYVSSNNEANLPGHVVGDAGLRVRLGPGALETSAQNLFGAYTGRLSSPRYAVPLMTTAAPLFTLATPIARTWTLRYTVDVGPRR